MNLTPEQIIEILIESNFWRQDQNVGIERTNYLNRLSDLAREGMAVTIVGPRRSGKSTIMYQLIKRLIDGGVPRENTLHVNFEDPRFYGELNPQFMSKLFDAYMMILRPKGKVYIFLDEVQNVAGWERFVRFLVDQQRHAIYITGSSSSLLSKELGTLLTGRHLDLTIYPLSFGEFLFFKGIKLDNQLDLLSQKTKIRRLVGEYMRWGGFPAAVLGKNKQEILLNYMGDILSRDIVERYNIKKVNNLKTLSKYYMTNCASLISFNSIKGFINMPVDTVERYSEYLNNAFLFFYLKRFSYSLKEQEKNLRKVFCIDSGLRNAVSMGFSEDRGKVLENIVFLKFSQKGNEVYYWKDKQGYEVDFIVVEGGKVTGVYQVSYSVREARTKTRETNALIRALICFDLKEGTIITENQEMEETLKGFRIRYMPVWKFLLS
ncbi:MAG: AAA family ATPase [Desulfobacterales bacterium]|jgi:predicted AAA+ superfamily ATPase|nr:AAA family ATPase [Desulfobacterales bacterium]